LSHGNATVVAAVIEILCREDRVLTPASLFAADSVDTRMLFVIRERATS